MNLHRNALATVLLAAGLSSVGGGTYAVPLGAPISLRDAVPQTVEAVQWRGGGWRGGWGGGWRGGWGGGWRGGWGGGWGGVGLGLAAGAIIGDAAPYYGGYGYYSSPYYGDGYDYGYSPAYYGDYYAPTYYGYGGGYGRSIYGGYWPGYRPRVIVHRPYWGSW
jgi:hypothetical protein